MAQPPADPPPVGAILTGPHWPDRVRVPKTAPAGPQSGDFRNGCHQHLAQVDTPQKERRHLDNLLIRGPEGEVRYVEAKGRASVGGRFLVVRAYRRRDGAKWLNSLSNMCTPAVRTWTFESVSDVSW